jgi:glutamine amidotransferase-like uncharacterized protein
MRRPFPFVFAALAVVGACLLRSGARAAEEEPPELREMTVLDRRNLEANLRWLLARERTAHAGAAAGRKATKARVGVFADAGCWHISAKSAVDALEKVGVPCRVLDRTLVDAEGLAGLEALVLPGGWSPFEFGAMTPAGGAAVRAFAERGGRVLGICAGAYLLSKIVVWEGKEYPYPIGLFDGTAQGPLAGFAPWPQRSPARLKVTKAGASRGLESLAMRDVLYYGGGTFSGGSETTLLATYADGGASILVRPVGKGEVILSGAHLERPAPVDGGDDAAPPASAGPWLKALLSLK